MSGKHFALPEVEQYTARSWKIAANTIALQGITARKVFKPSNIEKKRS